MPKLLWAYVKETNVCRGKKYKPQVHSLLYNTTLRYLARGRKECTHKNHCFMSRHISDHINGHHPSLSPSLQTQSQPSYSSRYKLCFIPIVIFLKSLLWRRSRTMGTTRKQIRWHSDEGSFSEEYHPSSSRREDKI